MRREITPCSFEDCKCLYIENRTKWLCHTHNFARLHDGKSEFQVAKENYKPIKSSSKRKEVLDKDREFYRLCFDTKAQFCEECNKLLSNKFEDEQGNIIQVFRYSHILSKGAWNRYRNELWNINILCLFHHSMWETTSRKQMNIYESNKEIVLKNTGLNLLK